MVDIKFTPPLSMAFGWNHKEHKEEIFFSFVLLVSFVVPSLTSPHHQAVRWGNSAFSKSLLLFLAPLVLSELSVF